MSFYLNTVMYVDMFLKHSIGLACFMKDEIGLATSSHLETLILICSEYLPKLMSMLDNNPSLQIRI